MKATTIQLSNIAYAHDRTLVRNGSIVIGEKISLKPADLPILDCSGYIALPGFFDCFKYVTENSTVELSMKASVLSGCTTVCLAGCSDESNLAAAQQSTIATTIPLRKIGDCWKIQESSTVKINLAGSQLDSGKSVIPLNQINNDGYFASGDISKQNFSVWDRIKYQTSTNTSPTEILCKLTIEPANSLHLMAGLIEEGYPSDLVLIKIESSWDTSSLESILSAVFLKGGRESVSAVFKSGRLIHSTDQFADLFKNATLHHYYTRENNLLTQPPTTHVFDTIEKAIQEIRNTILTQKWVIS